MSRTVVPLVLALTILVGGSAGAQDLVLSRFAEYVESLRVQSGIPGLAAAIVGSDDIIWERGFGREDTERALATRTDTPFHLDGLTQTITAALVLRCVEEGRLSLDDRVGQFKSDSPEPDATLRQLLSHTSGPSTNLTFAYRLDRLEPLARAVRTCTDDSFRETVFNLLDRLAMVDSVPGPDIIHPELLTEGIPDPSSVERYRAALDRLAKPYFVDQRGNASPSEYSAETLTPTGGLMSSVHDLAQFDLALKNYVLLRPETLTAAWRPTVGADARRLAHGLGWFVQTYNGEPIVWQFGVSPNASSSLMVTVPARGVTMILLANSDGLVKAYSPAAGDITVSPFVRLFLGLALR
jgi:CubicO group peptidase (beta-lactamase class C family)